MSQQTTSGINLDAPLAWTKASPDEVKMLQNLQGNILKGHGRHFTANILFQFDLAKQLESHRLLRQLANYHLTDAHKQLLDAKRFKESGVSGGGFCHLALTFKGYEALGLAAQAPEDEDFRGGMSASASLEALADPAVEHWETPFQQEIHGILVAAHEDESQIDVLATELTTILQDAGCKIVHTQRGKALFNSEGNGIEHFGYVDGRSQPLMLVEDITAEEMADGTSRWNPAFPLSTALVKDPGTLDSLSFGSFFVFRKLEQNVLEFKRKEQQIAKDRGLEGADIELIGALLVGRFEDGTPVTLSKEARNLTPPNDFNYEGDNGSRCPFQAHIRKTNPRGTGGIEPEPEERQHLMARRGIPFEDVKRNVEPKDLPESESLAEFEEKVAPLLPTGGVGLLFMAYNQKIANQFKFTQQNWANNSNFPRQPGSPHGIDPVIGQGENQAGEQKLPNEWDNPDKGTSAISPFGGFVTMKGGEYFFSPSLTFLKNL